MSHTCLLIKLHQSHSDAPDIFREHKKAELKESNLILNFHHFSKILWCSSRKRQECFSIVVVGCYVFLLWRRELVQRLKAKYLYTGIKNAATSKWNSSLTTNQGRSISFFYLWHYGYRKMLGTVSFLLRFCFPLTLTNYIEKCVAG